MRFDVLEPPRTYVKNSTHLALCLLATLERERGEVCIIIVMAVRTGSSQTTSYFSLDNQKQPN